MLLSLCPSSTTLNLIRACNAKIYTGEWVNEWMMINYSFQRSCTHFHDEQKVDSYSLASTLLKLFCFHLSLSLAQAATSDILSLSLDHHGIIMVFVQSHLHLFEMLKNNTLILGFVIKSVVFWLNLFKWSSDGSELPHCKWHCMQQEMFHNFYVHHVILCNFTKVFVIVRKWLGAIFFDTMYSCSQWLVFSAYFCLLLISKSSDFCLFVEFFHFLYETKYELKTWHLQFDALITSNSIPFSKPYIIVISSISKLNGMMLLHQMKML